MDFNASLLLMSEKNICPEKCACIDGEGVSYFQVEAIHPDCAIISEHLRAREMCSETRRSERQNQTNHSGEFTCDAAPCRALYSNITESKCRNPEV